MLGKQDPSSRSEAISPYTCLSRIKQIHFPNPPSPSFDLPNPSTDRLPQGAPLAIHVLSLTAECTSSRPLSPAWRVIGLVNPHHVICDGSQEGLATVDRDHFSHMTRLRKLDLKSCRFFGWPAELPALSFASPQDRLLVTYDLTAAPSSPPSYPEGLWSLSPFENSSDSWLELAHAAQVAPQAMMDGRFSFCIRFKTKDDARRALKSFDEEKETVWNEVIDMGAGTGGDYVAQLALDSPLLQRGLRVEYIGGVVYPFDSSYVSSPSLHAFTCADFPQCRQIRPTRRRQRHALSSLSCVRTIIGRWNFGSSVGGSGSTLACSRTG